MITLRQAVDPTEVLLIHAPYPGRLKFQGVPSSLFAAIGPFAIENPDRQVSYLDPREPSPEFDHQLKALLSSRKVKALCISTSTAAIEETARIANIAAQVSPTTLVIVGGPHENDIEQKAATRLAGVHVSVAGEAGAILRWLLERFLTGGVDPPTFTESLTPADIQAADVCGRFTVACSAWPAPLAFDRGQSRHRDPRPLICPERYPRFDVFDAPSTIPLMVSRGCSYGKCTFCAEANRDGSVIRTSDYAWVQELAARTPEAALYFQDSIFPAGNSSSSELLPLLRQLGREWGCQVYLPTLTERRVAELAEHGCTYLYTGVESGSPSVLGAIHKPAVTRSVVLERMRWARTRGIRLGISLMFGSMSIEGELLETTATLTDTRALAHAIADTGVTITGFYPNVQTVLPGTALARGMAASGTNIDFYTMPRCALFDSLEDGGVGYNFLTVAQPTAQRLAVAEGIVATAQEVQALAGRVWS